LVRILTAADVPGVNVHGVIPPFRDQPVFADRRVRFQGEAIAAVLGDASAIEAFDPADFPVAWRRRSTPGRYFRVAEPGSGSLRRAYVNDGGDIALHLAPGERFEVGIVAEVDRPRIAATATIDASMSVRGIAASGQGGRSFSLHRRCGHCARA
jgi:hypothetical protein